MYSEETQKKINTIKKFVKAKFGSEVVYAIPLSILADNLDLCEKYKKKIDEDGIIIKGLNGYPCRHSLLQNLKESQTLILRLLTEFGVTPKSLSKINLAEDDQQEILDIING